MRLSVALAVLLSAGAASAAGERLDIADATLPQLVVADVPFTANVTVTNRMEEPVTAVLYGALYAGEGGPCGAQTSERWRGVVSLAPAYAELELAPGETRAYPPRGTWTWRIEGALAPEDATYEVCVFVGTRGTAGLVHEDLWSAPLHVRPWNEPPYAAFTWSPTVANVTTPFVFRASADDPEGDAVTFAWDFGDRTAKGAATAVGPEATHRFYPEGEYRVTLAAHDGFATTRVTRTVTVLPEDTPTPADPEETPNETPLSAGVLVGVGVAALFLRRR